MGILRNLLTSLNSISVMKTKQVALILATISLISIFAGYIYAKNTFSETSQIVFDTIRDEDWRVEDFTYFPPSMTLILVYSINNPTNMSLDVEMSLDFYAGDYPLSNVINNTQLAPGETSTFEIDLAYDSEILEQIYGSEEGFTSFIMDGWFKVKGNVLYFPVESIITFENEDVLSILPAFDSIFDSE
jgi:hypothetical protein